MAGAGAGTIYPACLPTALKWFPDKASSISGLVQAGASCGPFIMSPIAQWLIDTYGAQMACRILGRPMRTAAPAREMENPPTTYLHCPEIVLYYFRPTDRSK